MARMQPEQARAGLAPIVEELRQLLARQSIRKGEFKLASGGTSHYYCDTKATVLHPRGAKLVGEVLFAMLRGTGAEAIGGLAMGATFLATAAALVSDEHGRPVYGFTVREKEKGHGTQKSIEESWHPSGKLLVPGRKVALVDDVVTQGGSVIKAIDAVLEQGCEIVCVLAIVDRNAGGGDKLRARGFDFRYAFQADERGDLHVDPRLAGASAADGASGAPRAASKHA